MATKMMDRLNRGEFLVCVIRGKDTIGGIVSTIADYHYIYGLQRSGFDADWTSTLREAITDDFNEQDQWNGDKFFKTRLAVDAMLEDATTYNCYQYRDKNSVLEACVEAGIEAYKKLQRQKFVSKLSGEQLVVDW